MMSFSCFCGEQTPGPVPQTRAVDVKRARGCPRLTSVDSETGAGCLVTHRPLESRPRSILAPPVIYFCARPKKAKTRLPCRLFADTPLSVRNSNEVVGRSPRATFFFTCDDTYVPPPK